MTRLVFNLPRVLSAGALIGAFCLIAFGAIVGDESWTYATAPGLMVDAIFLRVVARAEKR